MKRSTFLRLGALAFGGLMVDVNPYKLGINTTPKPLEPKLLVLNRFNPPYYVMNGDVFNLAIGGKEVLNLPITKMGVITFYAGVLHPDNKMEYIVGDDDLYNKMKPYAKI